jgi:hypothetical protein
MGWDLLGAGVKRDSVEQHRRRTALHAGAERVADTGTSDQEQKDEN